MRTREEIDKDIARHRKLLHRAVGNHILPVINYHHYCIVELLKEREEVLNEGYAEFKASIRSGLIELFIKKQDQIILNGNITDEP